MAAICRAFHKSCSSPRRQQREVAEGSPEGEPIGHALVAVRHKRRTRAVTQFNHACVARFTKNPTTHRPSPTSLPTPVRRPESISPETKRWCVVVGPVGNQRAFGPRVAPHNVTRHLGKTH